MRAEHEIPVIDADSHIIEPEDLWTSRVPSKWGHDVPHVRQHAETGEDWWHIGDERLCPTGLLAQTGWRGIYPDYPPTLEHAERGSFDPVARLEKLDENGITAQVLYPNLISIFAASFMRLERELSLSVIRAYNDFITDFCATDPDRLIALCAVPFWDVGASITEMERCAELGHRGVVFAHTFEGVGLPDIPDPRWDPFLDAAQSLGLPVNLHIGFGSSTDSTDRAAGAVDILHRVREIPRVVTAESAAHSFLSNARAISLLTLRGVCHRHPRLRFVSVESGFGYVPYLLQALDWQWKSNALAEDHPDTPLPSEQYRRQIFATMWFERPAAEELEAWQDNVMWETDYPHPTSQWPSPNAPAALPAQEAIEYSLGGVSAATRRKIVYDNAAKLYGIDDASRAPALLAE